MGYELAEELWARVRNRKLRNPFILDQIVITDGEAYYYFQSTYAPEHISAIFRSCGGQFISTQRMSKTTRCTIVRGFNREAA